MRSLKLVSLLIITIFVLTACKKKIQVDLIVVNATVYTVNDSFEVCEAIAIKDGKFVAAGSNDEIGAKYTSGNVLNAEGNHIYPGFNDGHSHFLGYGLMKTKYADLTGTTSFDEVIKRVVEHNNNYPGDWILGRGWDQNDWQNIAFPTNKKLDSLFPDLPVVLTRVDGHALIANSEALKRAGINKDTHIDGGEIKIVDGEVSGVLIDNAMRLVRPLIPDFTLEEKAVAFQEAQKDCFAVGLTTVTDAGLDKDEILLIDELQKNNKLGIRVYAMISPNKENLNYFFNKGPIVKDKLTVRSVKLYIDGALGSRGALLLEPYSDAPHTHGLQLSPQSYFDDICEKAHDAGYQVNTHAIGDSGNRIMLKSYAKYLKGKNDKRWRIEHAQVVNPADINYFKDYNIVPSVQATHCTSDMYWADERLGPERIAHAYAYQDLLNQNGWIVNGTDFPIEGISPLRTYYATIARKDLENWPEDGFQIENALSREDALRSITIWPAKGSFEEDMKGSIEVGKVADFVILKEDLINVVEVEIPKIEIVSTYVDGVEVYGK